MIKYIQMTKEELRFYHSGHSIVIVPPCQYDNRILI